jgi:aspartate ammonia-lyase
MEFRTERDSLGEVRVPVSAYYGAQTARALENYPISGMQVHPAMIENYVLLKKAAAEVLQELGSLNAERSVAIVRAADEILGGALRDQFVVDAFHSGAGTSFHMNVNEVLAGRANEILTGTRGGTSPVHPNDHVNMAQSTNDTFPTVMCMASRRQVPALIHVLGKLSDALAERGTAFREVVKSGRTHLQDAGSKSWPSEGAPSVPGSTPTRDSDSSSWRGSPSIAALSSGRPLTCAPACRVIIRLPHSRRPCGCWQWKFCGSATTCGC